MLNVAVAVMIFLPAAPAADATGGTWEGLGTEASPYCIDDAADLAKLADRVNSGIEYSGSYFLLRADIDLGVSPYNLGAGWTPIGGFLDEFSGATYYFDGTFDGDNHVIQNLTINTYSFDIGLFGGVGPSGKVTKLGIEGGSISGSAGNYNAGSIVGENYGKILSCYNTSSVTSSSGSVGGLVGFSWGTVSDCYNTGNVNGNCAGGVVGSNYRDSTVQNCYNTGQVSGSVQSGGVVGENEMFGEVSNCYNTGQVSGNNSNIGGVVGYSNGIVQYCYNTGPAAGTSGSNIGGVVGLICFSSTVSDCYNTGSVGGTGSIRVGGVVGYNDSAYSVSGTGGTISNCYNAGSVGGTGSSIGGVVGENDPSTVQNCYYNIDKYSGNGIGTSSGTEDVTGLSTADMTNGTLLDDLNAEGGTAFVMPYGTPDGCLMFYPELAVFAIDGTDLDKEMSKNSVMMCDCTLGTGEEYFTEGKGTYLDPYLIYTAEQLNHVREHFGSGAHFKLMCDIDLADWNIVATNTDDPQTDGDGWVPIGNDSDPFNGTFDGNGFAIENLTFSRTLYVGLFGYVGSDGTVENLSIIGGSASSYGPSVIGSVAGMNYGMVQYCYNTCPVSSIGAGSMVGGVVGGNGGTVQYCYNVGSVGGVDHSVVGGVTGFNYGGTAQYCYNTGPVSSGECSAAGGVIGENFTEDIVQYCYNTGPVSGGDGDPVGLFSAVGGVIGENDSGTVQYCYSTGSVTNAGENSYVGGVAGENIGGTVQYCYFNSENYSGGGIGKDDSGTGDTAGLTTAQMTDPGVLNGDMSPLDGAFHKRDADTQYRYYPELDVFYNGTEQQQTDSKNSAAVELAAPPTSPVKDYYITATSDSNSSISPVGTVTVQSGDSRTFVFFASPGYSISSVTVDGRSLTNDKIALGQYTFANVIMNHAIDVKSIYNPGGDITLSINIAQGKGYAEYSFDGGSTFTTYKPAVTIPPSSDIVVRAYADDGYRFVKWVTPSTYTVPEVSLGIAGKSLNLDLYFADNSNSVAHSNLLLWALCLIILLIIVCALIWFLLLRRRRRTSESAAEMK